MFEAAFPATRTGKGLEALQCRIGSLKIPLCSCNQDTRGNHLDAKKGGIYDEISRCIEDCIGQGRWFIILHLLLYRYAPPEVYGFQLEKPSLCALHFLRCFQGLIIDPTKLPLGKPEHPDFPEHKYTSSSIAPLQMHTLYHGWSATNPGALVTYLLALHKGI